MYSRKQHTESHFADVLFCLFFVEDGAVSSSIGKHRSTYNADRYSGSMISDVLCRYLFIYRTHGGAAGSVLRWRGER